MILFLGVFILSNKFPHFPDDLSNEFGSANSLETSGGIFDSIEDGRSSEAATTPTQEDAAKPASVVSDNEPKNSGKNAEIKGKKKGSLSVKVAVLLLIAGTAVICALVYLNTHVVLGELFGRHEIYASDTSVINLSGSDYSDYKGLSKIKSLETIDLTNSSFSDLSDLYGCEKLKTVILSDRELSAEECIAFYRHVPDALLICKININGELFDSQLTELTMEEADKDTQVLYAALRNLQFLDMTACEVSDDTYRTLTKAIPECLIVMRTTICGVEYTTDAETIRFEGKVTKGEVNQAGLFKKLKAVDIRYCTNPQILDEFLSHHPDLKLVKSIELLGRQVGTEDEVIDLRGKKYTFNEVKAALDETLPKMNSVKKIDMCGCGLSDKEMENLCAAYPEIKFVWMLHLVNWDLRTDALIFSALISDGKEIYNQNNYAPIFKYCTDLRALDLGHSVITDISAISSLKKLRAVILTDNKIRDISSFAELKDLEFIEMNATNKVSSIEPLRNLQNLKYINLWGSVGISDLSPLYDHKNLEIAIFERDVPKAEREKFIKSNPDCKTFFKVDSNKISTNSTWRENPYRKYLKDHFGKKNDAGILIREWKYVVGFDEKTGEFIVDYNTDQYAYR